MQLPAQAIQEFQELWKKSTGATLSIQDAQKEAMTLLLVLQAALSPKNRGDP